MKTRINVWIANRAYESLNELSIREGRSLSDLIREAIRDYLNHHKVKLGVSADGSNHDSEIFDSKSK